jgi:hypothetical protein
VAACAERASFLLSRGHKPYTKTPGMGASMQVRKGWLMAVAMLATGLAGCSGGDGDAGGALVTVENLGPEGGQGPYRFTANVEADNGNYTWDLGDRLTVLSGKTVEHTFDIKDATLTVSLRVRQGGAAKVYEAPVVLGTGKNESPAYALDVQTNWAVTGERVRFSAARSTDAEGDPLRFSWSCIVLEDENKLVRKAPHPHPGGPSYTPPKSGTVTAYLANTTLPAPDAAFDGDFCSALGTGTPPSTRATTIEGAFAKRGKYMLILEASDGAHPTVSGSYEFYVTRPDEKPSPWVHASFNVTLQAGLDGRAQPTCTQLPQPQTCDHAVSPYFEVPLDGDYGWLNASYNAAAPNSPQATNVVEWSLYRLEGLQVNSQEPSGSLPLEPRHLLFGAYTMQAKLKQGAQVTVEMSVAIHLKLDPFAVY